MVALMENIKIDYLFSHPEEIGTVAGWEYAQWGRKNGKSLDSIIEKTRAKANKNRIPLTLLAFKGATPVGCVALWENDLESRKDIRPYMAILYVVPLQRGQGIGTKLVEAAIREAKALGEKKLYLITDLAGFYEALGWVFESHEYNGRERVRLYSYVVR